MIRYPNLLEAHPYFPMAYFANITQELMVEVLNGNEDLSATEAYNMARYSGIPFNVLFNHKLITLDWYRPKHQRMMEGLLAMLYEIWEWQKKGSHHADIYMKYQRTLFVNLDLNFRNEKQVGYCRYLGVKKEMEDALLFIRNEQEKLHNKPRSVKK